jgi:hypothetical protein
MIVSLRLTSWHLGQSPSGLVACPRAKTPSRHDLTLSRIEPLGKDRQSDRREQVKGDWFQAS